MFGFADPVAILVVMTYEERFDGRELKFLVLPRQVDEVLDWARRRLAADRHATMGPHGDRYRVTTLYFDTPGFDVFGRQGSYARAKYRVRRYGDGAVVFTERKLKTRCVVSKRRSLLELEELPSLLDGALAGGSAWFGRRLAARDLRPVCTVSYLRTALIRLTKVLTETPTEKLEAEVEPLLDIEGTLRFLALEKVLVNSDGYWTRASDYSLYLDEKGRFHIIPYDVNETLAPAEMGPGGPGGFRGGPRGGPPPPGVAGFPPREMPPADARVGLFAGSNDPNKVLIHRLLAVPKLRARYLELCREIATKWLDWPRVESLVKEYQGLIGEDVLKDTLKLSTNEDFTRAVTVETEGHMGPGCGRKRMSLKQFLEERRAYVLSYRDPVNATQAK